MTRTAITVLLLLAMAIGILLFSASASAEQGVRVYGFVNDRTGLPVVNATVTLLLDNVSLPTASNPAITDLHGYYEFSGIQHGAYCLVAEKNDFSYSTTIYLQNLDLLANFNLQGSTADLADRRAASATPSPAAKPEIATATPAATGTVPVTPATPGFDVAIALLGVFFLGLAKRLKG
jgi:hypothetical protein